jgi:hypothetical protein
VNRVQRLGGLPGFLHRVRAVRHGDRPAPCYPSLAGDGAGIRSTMEERMRLQISRVGGALALGYMLAGGVAPAYAQSAAPASAALDPAKTIGENLARIQAAKKSVEVVLKGGKSYRGIVAATGSEAVLLTQIEGREFYDALIELDEIAAIELRVRGNP